MKKIPFGWFIMVIFTLLLIWEQSSWVALMSLGISMIIFACIYVSTLSLRQIYDILVRLAYKNYRGRHDFPELLYRYWAFWTVFWRFSFYISSGLWVVSIVNIVYSKIISSSSDWWIASPLFSYQTFVVSSLSYFFILSKAWRVESQLLRLRALIEGESEI